jgi:flagellar biosynthesis protein FlhG
VRPFSEQTHYEILEISTDASPEEIERAYRMALATYGDDSMAVYSLLSEEDSRATRERVDLAYEILSDPTARQRYDAGLSGEDDSVWRDPEPFPDPLEQAELMPALVSEVPPHSKAQVLPSISGFEDVDEEGDASMYDGARLRRARLLRGVEIDQIAEVTKVNPTYIHFIEDERFDDLPATVYVRGFVNAYARCLGLDAPGASLSYVERLQQHRGEGKHGGRN